MKDERIQTTVNRCAAEVFAIWFMLLPFSLCYRKLILKQHPRDFWDIGAIWFIGIFYGFIARANRGTLDHRSKKWLTMCISAGIAILAVQFILGQIHSVVDVGVLLIGFPLGIGPVIGISYFLNRHWKRKEGIEDEE